MTTPRFALRPTASGYTAAPGSSVVSTQLDGGQPRNRKDILNPSIRVTCTWVLTGDQYDYFEAFFNTTLEEGSLPFIIELVLASHSPAVYTASFVPDTKQLTQQDGSVYYMSASLDVNAPIRDIDDDADLVAAFNAAAGLS